MPKTWFENIFGAPENPKHIAALFDVHRASTGTGTGTNILKSRANHKEFCAGRFFTPNLEELYRDHIPPFLAAHRADNGAKGDSAHITVSHKVVNDIMGLHSGVPEDADAHVTFQAASQFNCLEFPGPDYIPEQGITNYVYDHTQGPACAVACPAGTVYRNYFAVLADGYQGQTAKRQLNCLADVEEYLKEGTGGLSWGSFWRVRNGYIFSSVGELDSLSTLLRGHDDVAREVRSKIRVGVQQGTDVLMHSRVEPVSGKPPQVTQVYCSAVSCAYSGIRTSAWAPFARLVLEAAYEATLWAALLFPSRPASGAPSSGRYKVYLTFLGAGAFGNDMAWIIDSINRAILKVRRALCIGYRGIQLEVVICHYRCINNAVVEKIMK